MTSSSANSSCASSNTALAKFTGGRLLARNTVFSLVGQSMPLLIAFFAVPLLTSGLGTERFGVLMLVWVVIGYFSLFDLGLGRALTRLVAEKLGTGREQEIPALVWTALLLILVLGLAGVIVVIVITPWLVYRVLKIPEALQSETLQSFYLCAFCIPIVVSTTGLGGILEALQRFDLVSSLRIIIGACTFLGPLLVLPFSDSLLSTVAVLVAGRLVVLFIHLCLCLRIWPALRQGVALRRAEIGPLLHFGSWLTVSAIVSPLMVTLDRFLIGIMVSVTAVAYYATPNEMISKFLNIPAALGNVLFPAFTVSFAQDPSRATRLLSRGIKYTFISMFPPLLFIMTFAYEGLHLWLGPEFAQNSVGVLQWLAVGVFMNSLARLAFTFVQGVGRADLTGKLHLIELPFYMSAVWILTRAYGIVGTAFVWTFRIAVDTLFLFGMTKRLSPTSAPAVWHAALAMGVALPTFALFSLPMGIVTKGILLVLVLVAFCLAAWFLILTREEHVMVKGWLLLLKGLLQGRREGVPCQR